MRYIAKYELYKVNSILSNELFFVTATVFLCFSVPRVIKWWQVRKKLPPGLMYVPVYGSLPLLLGYELHKVLHELRKKYGDIIGLYVGNQYTVMLNEYKLAKEVLSKSAALDRPLGAFHPIPQFGFTATNGDEWSTQRKFSMSTVRDLGVGKRYWEDVIMEEVNSFVEYLRKLNGRPTKIDKSLRESILSNMITFLIGRKLNKDEELDKIKLAVDFTENVFKYVGPNNQFTVIPGFQYLVTKLGITGYYKSICVLERFSKFIQEEIYSHKKLKSKEVHDFISVYLDEIERLKTLEKKTSFSESMLEGNTVSLFVGGSDTLFASLTWLLRHMTEHKDIQYKVYKELMEVLGTEKRVRYEERHKIPYTFAVIMESLRQASIVPVPPTRKLTQDIQVNGFTIPKGSEVTFNMWAMHNDTSYWEEPQKFNPERFLTENGTKLIRNPPSFMTFSIGRRNCPGETIAYMEILSYFTELIKKFEISIPPGEKTDYTVTRGLVTGLTPQALCFKARSY